MLFRLGWMLLLTAGQLDTQVNFYSDIDLFGFGTQFQPANTVELISVTFASSLSDCGLSKGSLSAVCRISRLFHLTCLECNLNVQCRTFDYDAGSSVCRLFEGAVDTGQVLATGSSTSRTGAVRLGKNLFANYGQPCTQCLQSRYLTCSSNNTCQCPPNTAWDSTACVNQAYEDASCLTNRWCRQDRGFVCSNLQFCTSKRGRLFRNSSSRIYSVAV